MKVEGSGVGLRMWTCPSELENGWLDLIISQFSTPKSRGPQISFRRPGQPKALPCPLIEGRGHDRHMTIERGGLGVRCPCPFRSQSSIYSDMNEHMGRASESEWTYMRDRLDARGSPAHQYHN